MPDNNAKTNIPENGLNFEVSLNRLEELVRRLERGDAPLGDALGMFEEGTALVRNCSKLLDEAEQKVLRLQKGADGQPELYTFEDDEAAQ